MGTRAGAGTLTLLFTDLVGSTKSLVTLGEDRFDSGWGAGVYDRGGALRVPAVRGSRAGVGDG